VGLSDDGQRDTDQQTQQKVEYDDRIVFKLNARFRIKARDIEPIQKSLLEWAKKWRLDL